MEILNNKIPPKTYQRAFKNPEPISISRYGDIPVEFESVCRLCLQKSDCMSDIFKDDSIVQIVVKIKNLLGLRIQEEDNLPSLICDKCLITINEFHEFKKRCIASDVRLRQVLLKRPPKHPTPTSNTSAQDSTTLAEDISDPILKNDCTISWDDHVPLASIILTEFESAQRQLSMSNREAPIDEENTLGNHTEENATVLEDHEKLSLAQRMALEQRDNKLKPSSHCIKKLPSCKNVKCQDCSKTFKSLSLLKRHSRVHTREQPFICHLCQSVFAHTDSLHRHLRQVHGTFKPFKCPHCFKRFSMACLLTYHIKSSHLPKPKYRCCYCPKVFKHSSGLSRHKNFHSGQLFVCVICKKKFTDPSSVTRHVRMVHCVKP